MIIDENERKRLWWILSCWDTGQGWYMNSSFDSFTQGENGEEVRDCAYVKYSTDGDE